MKSRATRLAVLTLVSALALTGCSGDGDGDDKADDKTNSTTSETETTDDGITDPGTELELGQAATITWEPKVDVRAEASVAVSAMQKTTMKDFAGFRLSPEMQSSTPYYVKVAVENTGDTDLSGVALPIYLDNGSDVLIPAAEIASAYKPCPSRPLPAKFTTGQKAQLCLVFLAPQATELKAIALRPSETLEPITWTGQVTRYVAPKKPAKKKG